MRVGLRSCTLATVVALLAGLVFGLPQAAHADTPTLGVVVTRTDYGGFQANFSGTATEASYLFAFHQPASTPCAETPAENANAGGTEIPHMTLPAGSYAKQAPVAPGTTPGKYTVCAYLAIPSSDPRQPGPRYAPPAAFASATLTAYACSDLDSTFSVSRFSATTTWDPGSQETHGQAAATVTVNDPGYLVVTGPEGYASTRPEGPPTIEFYTYDENVTNGKTSTFTITFYPGADGKCAMDDGTIVPTGKGSAIHGVSQQLEVTWFSAGQGGQATVNGTVVPGSSTPHEVPSHTPVITGTSRVGMTVECSVTIPKGDHYLFGWYANGKGVREGRGQTLTIPGSLAGKSLTCSVASHAADGFPATSSAPVKVAIGLLRLKTRPTLMGSPTAGGAVAVTFGKWAPETAVLDYSYQWYFGSKPIKGATKSNYLIPKSARGKTLSCKQTVTAEGYKKASASTKAVTIR